MTVKTVRIQIQPTFVTRMDYEQDGHRIVLGFDGRDGWKTVDGVPQPDRASRNHARNATFGAEFMLGLPFKLADPGTQYRLVGPDSPSDSVQRVLVTYAPGTGDAAGHVYEYEFDEGTGRLEQAWIRDAYVSVVVVFSDWREVDGLTLATRRVRYESDEHGRRLEKAGESVLEGIRLNEPLEPSLFAEP